MNDSFGAPAALFRPAPRDRPLLGLAETRRPIVAVLGPPHSGTSVCAYALSLLGLDMADAEPRPAPADAPQLDNGRTHHPVRQFHDRILETFNHAASGPFYDFALPVAWWADPQIVAIRCEMAAFLADKVAAGNFGFADPRTMRLLPLWQQIFAELKLLPKFVLCQRNPALIARSAQACEGLDPDIAEYRWFVHMADYYRYAGKGEHCAVEYQAWCEYPAANLDKLQNFLGIDWLHGAGERELALASIAALAGAAGDPHGAEPRQPLIRSFYRRARESGDRPGGAGSRDQIVQQFVAFQQLQKPIEKALAAHAAAAAEMTRQRDGLAAQCTALGSDLASARAILAAQDAAQAQGRTQLQGLHQTVAERDRTVEALQARTGQAEAALSAMQGEREAIRAALAQSEKARHAARAQVAAVRQELDAARCAADQQGAALRSAQAEIAEHDAVTAALQARLTAAEHDRRRDVAQLRAALRRAGSEAARYGAEKEQVKAEIATLGEALAAARLAGSAAMQALAAAAPVAAPPAGRAGWLTTIGRRLLGR